MSGTRYLVRAVSASAVAALAMTALAPASGSTGAAAAPGSPAVQVIVQATTAAVGRSVVEAAGGEITRDLPLIDAVAAVLPAAAVATVAVAAGVRAVTPDATMHVQATLAGTGPDGAAADPPSVYRKVVRADKLATSGHTGAGVTVALLDTGISPVGDLAGRVRQVTAPPFGLTTADCVNLSGEPSCSDGYGHGTFLAGLIAGSGDASGGLYKGVAPDAELVSIKVASSDGSADVSNVIAGIQWAVAFKNDHNIGVLNLSLGTNSTQSWKTDPLNYAVQKAWDAGIVVVVAASNRGPEPGTISKPGDDPWVITVGATDDVETAKLGDDRVPDFSGRGPTSAGIAKPDVAAPGARLVSLIAPGSTVDVANTADPVLGAYQRGSGTSMATAVVSGAVAAIRSAKPAFNPNRVKFVLAETARPLVDQPEAAIGRGVIDAYAAAIQPPAGKANQGLKKGTGTGSLDLSRGTVRVETALWGVLEGLEVPQLVPLGSLTEELFDEWTALKWWATPWAAVGWLSTSWSGDNWEGDNWEGCTKGTGPEACAYGTSLEGSAWYGAWD